jgi:lipoprotein-releasing system permease protein
MFKPVEAFIGLRYLRARKKKGTYVSFIVLASMIGMAISVLVLITVLSIMSGFEQALRERVLGMLSHVTVSTTYSEIDDWQDIRDTTLQFPNVKGVAPYIQQQVMLNVDGEVRGVSLQGIMPELQKTIGSIENHMTGSFDDLKEGEKGMILGDLLAKDLGVEIGDDITAISMRSFSLENGEMPTLQGFKVVGTFKLDMKIYDSSMAFIHIKDAAEMLDMGNRVTGVRLQLEDMSQAPAISELIYDTSPPEIWVTDWTHQNSSLFKAIKMQKTMFFFILIMLVAVAAFNLVSTMIMVVTDKNADIAILRTLGISPGGVMKVFLVQGVMIAVIGTAIGVLLGAILAVNIESLVPLIEKLFGVNLVTADTYFISKIKGALEMGDVLLIVGSTLFLALLATIYPSWKASKVQPAEALRYE